MVFVTTTMKRTAVLAATFCAGYTVGAFTVESGISTSPSHRKQPLRAVVAAMEEDTVMDVAFPPPLSATDRLKRAATFWSTAVPIIANYYGLIGTLKLNEILGKEMTDEEIEVCM